MVEGWPEQSTTILSKKISSNSSSWKCIQELWNQLFNQQYQSYRLQRTVLHYIKYQDKTLIDCIEEHNGLKIVLQMFACSRNKTTNELMQHKTRSRMYIITSKEEIPPKNESNGYWSETQFDKMETLGGGGGGEPGTYIYIIYVYKCV